MNSGCDSCGEVELDFHAFQQCLDYTTAFRLDTKSSWSQFIPIGGALIGVLVGFSLTKWSDSRKNKKEEVKKKESNS
jgi:hypothetical protein